MINFDANACYGLLPEVAAAIKEQEIIFANPSSIHQAGQDCRVITENARNTLANLLKLNKNQRVVFTSGASEANNQAISYAYWKNHQDTSINFVTTAIEHPSVLEPLAHLEKQGFKVTKVNPNTNAEITVEDVLEAVDQQTVLLSIMYANNETGLILPVQKIIEAVKEQYPDVLIHIDAVQAVGKVDLNFGELLADFISISGHKLGALTGVGALIVNDSLENIPLILGGPQESRWRAGTENTLGIYSLGLASEIINEKLVDNIAAMQANRAVIKSALESAYPKLEFNSEDSEHLPNTLSVEIPEVLADDLVVALDLEGVCISSGAACGSGKPLPSHVLLAMGKTEEQAKNTIRLSVRADLTPIQREKGTNSLLNCIQKMKC